MVNSLSSKPLPTAQLDFGSPALYGRDDIHDVWAELRTAPPVRCESETLGFPFWVVTRYEDTRSVLAAREDFTSERGMMLVAAATGDPAGGRMLVATDPPRHTALRKLFAQGLSRAVLEAARVRVHAAVTRALDAAEGAEIDAVDALAAPIPVAAICGVLGVPAEDEEFLAARTRIAFAAEDPAETAGRAATKARGESHVDILLYFDELIAEKRRRPCDDLLTVLAHGTIDGARLPVEDILVNCDNVLLGGNETTRYAIASALLTLVEHEAAWKPAFARGTVTHELVEELLRWTSPGQHVMRVARRDVTVGGVSVGAGDRVTCWIPSANRDESVFREGRSLDLAREPNPHLTFGNGNHYCWGAAFAKMELGEVFGELLRRRLRPRLTGKPARVRSTVMNGLRTLPVVFERV